MRFAVLLGALLLVPTFARASCEDLWLTRNIVFDRAGYFFGSVLGQAVFDNRDCRTKSPALTAADRDFVAGIKAMEARYGCRVDTSAPFLNVTLVNWRRAMLTLPVADEFEMACWGWRGAPIELLSGAWDAAPVIAQVAPGDALMFEHLPVAGFAFVQVQRQGQPVALGWTRMPDLDANCTEIAG